ncbi:hypothetical protein SLS54_009231 [Diplodia seriata]
MDQTQQEKPTDVHQPLRASTDESKSTDERKCKKPSDTLHEILFVFKLAVKRRTLELLTGLGSKECSELIEEFEFYEGQIEGSDRSTVEAVLEVAVISERHYGHELIKHISKGLTWHENLQLANKIEDLLKQKIKAPLRERREQLGAIYLAAKERGYTGTILEFFAEQYSVDEKGSDQSHEDKKLHPIQEPAEPREIQAMDFVVKLPPTRNSFDMLLSITRKATKELLLLKGKENWSAPQWADKYVRKILSHGWGIPRIQITDRDLRFTYAFWKQVCQKLGIAQHMTTGRRYRWSGAAL